VKMKSRIPQILHWVCRIILAVMFLYTGYIKIQAPLQFAVTILGYELFPEAWIPFFAKWFPWAEVALGFFLLFDGVIFGRKSVRWDIRYVAAATSALLLFFTVILTITYLRGIEANCGCFSFDDRITPRTILRDGIILLPALYLLFERRILKCLKPAKSGETENPENPSGGDESNV